MMKYYDPPHYYSLADNCYCYHLLIHFIIDQPAPLNPLFRSQYPTELAAIFLFIIANVDAVAIIVPSLFELLK